MKSPREILLERHRQADEKLDVIRENVVVRKLRHGTRSTEHESFLSTINHQLSTFLRLRWLALAPLWIVILTFKLSTHDTSHIASGTSRESREVAAEVREQKLFFAELIGATEQRDADRPKIFLRPRSELRVETAAT